MADKSRAPWGFLIWILILHSFDALLRYGTSPLSSYWIWVMMLFFHTITLIMAANIPEFRDAGGIKAVWWVAVIAYFWGPLLALVPQWLPGLAPILALLMVIAPFWLLMLFIGTREFPRLSLCYMILWVIILTWAFMPQIQDQASEYGYAGISPGTALRTAWEKVSSAFSTMWETLFVKAPGKLSSEIERQLALAKGDYYTGKVDEAAGKRLGVFLENFRAEQPVFSSSRPVTVFATLKAETLDEPITINIDCFAKKDETLFRASEILPKSVFEVYEFEQRQIDCIFDPNTLEVGRYTAIMNAEFDFSTKAYLKTYMMDSERLREFRQQDIDPLAGITPKNPVAVYTSGPVRIGMDMGIQPVAISTGEKLPPLGISLENIWSGNILGITNIFFFTPKGINLDDLSGIPVTKTDCSKLPSDEDRLACDNLLMNVYTLPSEELNNPKYVNQTLISFRAHTSVADLGRALGQAPVSVQNFKVSVDYRYQVEQTASLVIRAEQ